MINVKMITNRDLTDEEPVVLKGETVYEEDFNNESEIDYNDFLGKDYTLVITDLETGVVKKVLI